MTSFENWLNPSALSNVAKYRERFEGHSANVLQIQDFLVPESTLRVAQFLEEEAEFQAHYGLHFRKNPVASREEWLGASEDERFFHYSLLVGAKPEFQLSPNALAFMKLRKALNSPGFNDYISGVTGMKLTSHSGTSVHRMGAAHYLRPHSDRLDSRRLAFIVYLSRHWQPDFGGNLHILEAGQQRTILKPDFNSLVLFDVNAHEEHYVTPIGPEAGVHSRLSIGGWLGE